MAQRVSWIRVVKNIRVLVSCDSVAHCPSLMVNGSFNRAIEPLGKGVVVVDGATVAELGMLVAVDGGRVAVAILGAIVVVGCDGIVVNVGVGSDSGLAVQPMSMIASRLMIIIRICERRIIPTPYRTVYRAPL